MSSNIFELLPSDIWNYEISKHLSLKDKMYLGNSCSFMKNMNLPKHSSNLNADFIKINSNLYFEYKDIVDSITINKTIVLKQNEDVIKVNNIICDNIIVNNLNTVDYLTLDIDSLECNLKYLNISNLKLHESDDGKYDEKYDIKSIEISNCKNIFKLFSYNLTELVINKCSNLKDNETIIPFIPTLEKLTVSHSNITSINSLKNLKKLSIDSCYYIIDINELINLTHLSLKKSYVRNIQNLRNLKYLELVNNEIRDLNYNSKLLKLSIISSIITNNDYDNLNALEELTLYDCSYASDSFRTVKNNVKSLNLSYISDSHYFNLLLFPNTKNLSIKFVTNISTLCTLKNLTTLSISESSKIDNICNFEKLQKLSVKNININSIYNNKNLNCLEISNCGNICNIKNSPNLEVLSVKYSDIKEIDCFPKLKDLTINSSLISNINFENYGKLKFLKVIKYNEVLDLLPVSNTLHSLVVDDSKHVCNINKSVMLKHLKLVNSDVSYIDRLLNLNNLTCISCNKLKDISNLSKLNYLFLDSCENIRKVPKHIENEFYAINCKYLY